MRSTNSPSVRETEPGTSDRRLAVVLVLAAMVLVVWIRTLPLSLGGIDPSERAHLTFAAADGVEHVHLGDYDSYYWLRAARRYLESGTICDRIVDGACRDDHSRAPFGGLAEYPRSLHVRCIAWLHRLMTLLRPGSPLQASAFWVPVVIGALGVLPAFALGRRLSGPIGGVCAAVLIGVNPLFLERSIGSDNDVWNVVLPLCLVWAAVHAVDAVTVWRQVGWSAVGLLCVGLHALTWNGWVFTYAVVLLGLGANVAVTALRRLTDAGHERRARREVRRAAIALACFGLSPLVLVAARPSAAANVVAMLRPVSEIFGAPKPASGAAATARWPDAFASVGELTRPGLTTIAGTVSGVAYFFGGWLGLLVLLLPRRHWQWWHFAMLIGGNYLYAYLVVRPEMARPLLLVLIALPLCAAMLVSVLAADLDEDPERSAALLLVCWFLAALFLAFDGTRFVMLLVPPFGIVLGVALGRGCDWLTRLAARPSWPRWLVTGVPLLAAVALYPPIRAAYGVGTAYVPKLDDAWWGTLTALATESPPQTIVSTWWPYGYWVEYAADRRTSVDGGTLPTRVPYWMARVLFTPSETEAVGLLRMMDCGSDYHPVDAGSVGAYDRLIRQGVDGLAARDLLVDMALRTRAEAQERLRSAGIAERAQSEILDVTHCVPPPAYLVLSTDMVDAPGWRFLGNWRFDNAYVAERLASRPESEAVREIVERFHVSEGEARAWHRRAAQLGTDAARTEFISPPEFYRTPAWVPCSAAAGGQAFVCPLNVHVGRSGAVVTAFTYPHAVPSGGRLRWQPAVGGTPHEGNAAAILVAGADQIDEVTRPDPIDARLAVLVDPLHDRILVGTPALLRSTYTQLMFLDGRYAHAFRKVSDRTGHRGARVVTWAVDWPGG